MRIRKRDRWVGKPIADPEVGVPDVLHNLETWKRKANILRGLQILLGSLSVTFSLVTTTLLDVSTTDNYYAKISAFIAAVSIGLMTAFDLGTKSNNMMNAWRGLNAAVIKFNGEQGWEQYYEVLKAYEDGEKLIGNVTFQEQGKPTTKDERQLST